MKALVRRPGPRLADGIVTHLQPSVVDVDVARRQWDSYVAALTDTGWDVEEIEPADDCPDGVFIEDTAVVFEQTAFVCRPGAESRRPEVPGARDALEAAGYTLVNAEGDATIDGGDVLKVGHDIYVGRTARTNDAGIAQLAAAFEPLGARVIAVPTTRVLHLKSAVTALPDGTVIGYDPVVDDPTAFATYLSVPEESGAHVVDLGDGRLLMAAGAERSAELFRARGYTPVVVDISEYEKLEGCVTCLSIRLRDRPVRGR